MEENLRGALRFGRVGNATEPAFTLFVPGREAMRVVGDEGCEFSKDQLIPFVNLNVAVRGIQNGDTFRLRGISRLESPPLPTTMPHRFVQ